MQDPIAVDPVVARNQLAALHRGSAPPDPLAYAAARAKLAVAKIDKAVREATANLPAPLHPAQVDYLVGLIVSAGEAGEGA